MENVTSGYIQSYPANPAPCPTCGHCPTCGRGGYQTTPYYPTWPSQPPQITWTSTNTTPFTYTETKR